MDLQDVLFFVELNYPQQSFYNKQVKDLTLGLGKRNECIVEHIISVYKELQGESQQSLDSLSNNSGIRETIQFYNNPHSCLQPWKLVLGPS